MKNFPLVWYRFLLCRFQYISQKGGLVVQPGRHLLLLVGANPLPNAVAAKQLADSATRVTLLHSADSRRIAEHLCKWLANLRVGSDIRLREIQDESDPAYIFREVHAALDEGGAGDICLHYTGGTKAMAVHAHRAMEQWVSDHQRQGMQVNARYCYLDARRLRLLFDPPDPRVDRPKVDRVGDQISLELEDLLALHGWETSHQPCAKPILPRSAAALAKVCAASKGDEAWRKWLREELHLKCWHPNNFDKLKGKTALQGVSLTLPDDEVLAPVVEALQLELGLKTPYTCALADLTCMKPEKLCKWLDGEWLEHYVLSVLLELTDELGLHDCVQDLATCNPEFQVDVVALHYYQLFVFSCTTDTKKHVKQKLFEANIRSHQLGGDEASTGLVCFYDNARALEQELRQELDAHDAVRVFGRQELSDLPRHVREWIVARTQRVGA